MRDIKSGLTSMVYNFFDKKTASDTIKNENMSKKKVAEELHKTIIRKTEQWEAVLFQGNQKDK